MRQPELKICNGKDETQLDIALSGHKYHCPNCDIHLTSLGLCSNCGVRFVMPKWRVGWRLLDAAKSEPTYGPDQYDTFADADYVAREMKRIYPNCHFFVTTTEKEHE